MHDRAQTTYLRATREVPDYAWWKMPVATLIGVAAYFALTLVIVAYLAVGAASADSIDVFENFLDTTELSTSNVWILGILLLTVAYMLPATQVGRYFLVQRIGDLFSVEGRLRWRWLGVMMVVAMLVYGVVISGALVLEDQPTRVEFSGHAFLGIAIVLATVPFQASAEEVVFRGQLMQMIGSWTRWAWIPVLVTTLLFVAGHGYELIGLIDVGIFGVTAAILTIRTGGLEAAMAAHIANNVVLLCADLLGAFDSVSTEVQWVDLIPTVISSVVMIVSAELLRDRMGVRRTRDRLPDPLPKHVQPVYLPPAPTYPYSYPPPRR